MARRRPHAPPLWRAGEAGSAAARAQQKPPLVDLSSAPASTADFEAMHVTLSTSPDSGFVRVASVLRRSHEGSEVLRGCVFTEQTEVGMHQRDIDTADEWWSLVLDHFGLGYGDLFSADRADLWRRVRATHRDWDAAGRP